MNKDRRKQLEKISETLSDLQGQIEILKDEEQDYFDNMPESFQSGEKGSMAEQAIEYLDEAMQSLESAVENINESIQ